MKAVHKFQCILVNHSHYYDKILLKRQFQKKVFRGRAHHGVECEAAGHMTSAIRKQRVRNTRVQLTFSFLIILDTRPLDDTPTIQTSLPILTHSLNFLSNVVRLGVNLPLIRIIWVGSLRWRTIQIALTDESNPTPAMDSILCCCYCFFLYWIRFRISRLPLCPRTYGSLANFQVSDARLRLLKHSACGPSKYQVQGSQVGFTCWWIYICSLYITCVYRLGSAPLEDSDLYIQPCLETCLFTLSFCQSITLTTIQDMHGFISNILCSE